MTIQSPIPQYPLFVPINMGMKEDIDSLLSKLPDGISEFTFLNLYIFRKIYNYTVSKYKDMLIIEGFYKGVPFFITALGTLDADIVSEELKKGLKWSHISQSLLEENRAFFLSKLEGKELHKKKTHINKFEKTYSNIEIKELTKDNVEDAFEVLEEWKKNRKEKDDADYEEAKEALNLLGEGFSLKGVLIYIENVAIAWTLAEVLEDKNTAIVLFEKAISSYKGSYQYVNYAFASFLDEKIKYVNREQDLGDEGLRQSKMTYRPIKFVKKYMVLP